MRKARIKDTRSAYYHVMSHTIDNRWSLCDADKRELESLMQRVAAFCGVQILTYAILSNHFHVLLYVPAMQPVTDDELLSRLRHLYDERTVRRHAAILLDLRSHGTAEEVERYRTSVTYRMYDLSEYMKTVKQRFTQFYNRRHGRKGTLWQDRFKSVLLQPAMRRGRVWSRLTAPLAVARYIDLNPVRAGLAEHPGRYEYCGYSRAVSGDRDARKGIAHVVRSVSPRQSWATIAEIYVRLLDNGKASSGTQRIGIERYRTPATIGSIRQGILGSPRFVARTKKRMGIS